MKYYLVRNKETGEFCSGTGKHAVPKLYTLGTAKSTAAYKNNSKNYLYRRLKSSEWEVIPVNIILYEEKPENFVDN